MEEDEDEIFFDEPEETTSNEIEKPVPDRSTSKYKNINELETYTIKCLLTSQVLLSKFIDNLKTNYFQSKENRTIFRVIKNYYKELGYKIPNDEIFLRLEDVLPGNNVEDKNKELRDKCKEIVQNLLSGEEVNQESATKNISNFIIKRVSEEALDELINDITGSNSNNYEDIQYYSIEKCLSKIRESTNLQIDVSAPFNLADVNKIPEIRKEGLGEGGGVVKFYLDSLNDTLQYDGINVGTVACVMACPGSGKTTFLTNQGLFSAKQGLKVCHCYIGDMEKFDGLIRYYSIYKESEYMKIEILNKSLEKKLSAYKRLLLKQKEGSDYYISYSNKIRELEEKIKSNNELDKEWKKNKIVLTSKQLVSYNDEDLVKLYGSDPVYLKAAENIDIVVYPVGAISMDGLRQSIYNWQKEKKIHYDVIIIDYDSNLKQPADNMYESYGVIYDQAKNLAQVNKSVVFIASQPAKAFWKNELVPLEACSESSKKQMIIDILITIGRPEGCNTGIRKVFIPKNRRGKENEIIHAKMNGDTGFMYEISQEEYEKLKKEGYDPTLVISAAGMYGNRNKKKKEDQQVDGQQELSGANLPENMKTDQIQI